MWLSACVLYRRWPHVCLVVHHTTLPRTLTTELPPQKCTIFGMYCLSHAQRLYPSCSHFRTILDEGGISYVVVACLLRAVSILGTNAVIPPFYCEQAQRDVHPPTYVFLLYGDTPAFANNEQCLEW